MGRWQIGENMNQEVLTYGSERTKVTLTYYKLGESFVVAIYNENPHLGAIAMGEYDNAAKRTSGSVITSCGHKEDTIALQAAHKISRQTEKSACVIAGIHLDNITLPEIEEISNNCDVIVDNMLASLKTKNGL